MSNKHPVVFIIDDDASVRKALTNLLCSVGLKVEAFGTAQEFLTMNRPDGPGCLVLDVRLPGSSGLDLQRQLAESGIQLPIIFITGHGDIEMSVQAMKGGAVEFLTKPFREQVLLDAVQHAIERDREACAQRAALAEWRERYESLTARERLIPLAPFCEGSALRAGLTIPLDGMLDRVEQDLLAEGLGQELHRARFH